MQTLYSPIPATTHSAYDNTPQRSHSGLTALHRNQERGNWPWLLRKCGRQR